MGALVLSLFLMQPLLAQHAICGTSDQASIVERLSRNRVTMQDFVRPRGAITYVPIKMHLTADDSGNGRVNEIDVLEMLCILNEEYAEQEIQFYFSNSWRYLDNNSIYDSPSSSAGRFQISLNKVNNAINIFIANRGGSSSGSLAFYQPPANPSADYIVCNKAWIRGESVIPHEIGHFFSLAHPFYGWEGHPYDPDEHGNPVGINAPSDPNEIGNVGLIKNEKQNGGNCTVAADRICDTKPDYLFAFSTIQNFNCNNYSGNTMDPDGVVVNPIESNIMSYFNDCDNYTFTADQKTAIELDLFASHRSYIRPNYTPNTTEITEDATLIKPAAGSTTEGYNVVKFEWEAPTGADSYIVQLDELPTFNFNMQQFIVHDNTFLVVNDLKPGRAYHWRVRSFNELHTCSGFSSHTSFVTGTELVNVRTIEAVNGWAVLPNPVRSSEQLQLQLDANEAFEAQLKLYSVTGQQLKHFGAQQFSSGANTVHLDVNDLETGMYFLMIETAEGLLTEKIVLAD